MAKVKINRGGQLAIYAVGIVLVLFACGIGGFLTYLQVASQIKIMGW
jgi:hypothetical protein